MEDKIKRKTIMKNGWLIQTEKTDSGTRIMARQEKTHKDKEGNIVGRSSINKEVYFSALKDEDDLTLDKDHGYDLDDADDL
jgi:hypothetical protein